VQADDTTNLFEIIVDRTELNSTIITSQLPVSEWCNYLNNNTIADAILDRIIHSSHRIELSGPSMRKSNQASKMRNIEKAFGHFMLKCHCRKYLFLNCPN